MQQFYIPFSFCRITLEGYFKPPVVRSQLVLRRLLSILPDIHSGAESEVSICPLPNECQ